ncbi:MAG: coproporphyrinogen III oxidase [Candidatus Schekmanbacteria bacterium]|nr:MAG: coproporphyrinogen III oxidase [Candidatus Schekmanbacteria bacterium]
MKARSCLIVVLSFFILFSGVGIYPFSSYAADGEKAKTLTPEEKKLTERMLKFMEDMDKRYFERAFKLNGNRNTESKEIISDYSDYDIKVTRGPVIEKMGRMLAVGKKAAPNNRLPGNLVWGRFYSIDAHPKTPLVGMLHATIVVQVFDSGISFAGGWIGIMPGTRIEEDLNELKETVDAVFKKFGKSPDYNRQLICKGDPKEIDRKWRRKPACVGVSFYGRPLFFETEKNFDLVSEVFVNFVDKYMDLVEKRKDDPYTEKDIQAQDEMRKRWLLDQLFSDPYAKKIVPFEAWSLANVPPVIKF